MSNAALPKDLRNALLRGLAIVAHPLALRADRSIDEARQRALTLYYLSAGADGVAVGVHTTQFALHDRPSDLKRVLEMASEEVDYCGKVAGKRFVKVAGIVGDTKNAVEEAKMAWSLGYHAGLVSLHKLAGLSEDKLIQHVKEVSREIPVFGFYLQQAVGGIRLGYSFWRRLFEEVENIVAVKVAPFNRYATVDVMRALADSGRVGEIALYTGNDDSIIVDLLSRYRFIDRRGEVVEVRIVGGLLGHWAFWTRRSMQIYRLVKRIADEGSPIPPELMALNTQVTDVNGAVFDAANSFRGVNAGILEVLRRSGLVEGRWTLDPGEDLSPGQLEEIDRVYSTYPHLRDDEFVKAHLDQWLRGECRGLEDYADLTIEDVRKMAAKSHI